MGGEGGREGWREGGRDVVLAEAVKGLVVPVRIEIKEACMCPNRNQIHMQAFQPCGASANI
jgi:hypothetical protein